MRCDVISPACIAAKASFDTEDNGSNLKQPFCTLRILVPSCLSSPDPRYLSYQQYQMGAEADSSSNTWAMWTPADR